MCIQSNMKTVTEIITDLRQQQTNFVGDWDAYDKLGDTIDLLEEYSQ